MFKKSIAALFVGTSVLMTACGGNAATTAPAAEAPAASTETAPETEAPAASTETAPEAAETAASVPAEAAGTEERAAAQIETELTDGVLTIRLDGGPQKDGFYWEYYTGDKGDATFVELITQANDDGCAYAGSFKAIEDAGDAEDYIRLVYRSLLFLAFLGDVFLVFDFGRGGDFFLSGNVCFIIYEQIILAAHGYKLKDFFWIYIVAGIMLTAFIIACDRLPDKIKIGKMRWPMTFYLSSIFTHGISGLALMLMLPNTNFFMMGLGSFLFMISDMILTSYKFIFDNNKWLIRLNSLTYFTGILLIVLATL